MVDKNFGRIKNPPNFLFEVVEKLVLKSSRPVTVPARGRTWKMKKAHHVRVDQFFTTRGSPPSRPIPDKTFGNSAQPQTPLSSPCQAPKLKLGLLAAQAIGFIEV